MGEVYLAEDMELNRLVAIKFLSSEFGLDEKLRNRFMQEVRSVSILNHPHILTVYEFGKLETEDETLHYFVSEFVEGETLRSYLEKERLILGDILDITIQTASALVAAHEAGIIHRDIKPENIMVRRDGYIKVLDFGLAKPLEADSSVDLEANTKVLTNPGTIMGTVNYMSPEQARGVSTDARTDIWSLGVVFYEMITGRVPFEGDTTSHTIVSILEKQPPPLVQFIQPVPESLQFVTDEMLVKDPEERCQTAKELLGKLKRLKQHIDTDAELDRSVQPNLFRSTDGEIGRSSGAPPPQMTAVNPHTTGQRSGFENVSGNISSAEYLVSQIKRNKTGVFIALAVSLFLIAGVSFAAYQYIKGEPTLGESKNTQPLKLTKITNNEQSFNPVISPDGKNVVFLHKAAGKMSLRLRQIARNSFVDLIPDLNGNFLGATFTPDGNDLYYVSGEKGRVLKSLYKISVLGGEPQKVFEDVDSSVSFSPDGKKLVFLRVYPKKKEKVLIVANADGTDEQQIVKRNFNEAIQNPAWSPDGKTIAFCYYGQDDAGYFVYVDGYDLENKTERRITKDRWRNIPAITWLADNSAILMAGRDFDSAPGSPHQLWKIPFPEGKAEKITNDLIDYKQVSVDENSQNLIAEATDLDLSLWIVPQNNAAQSKQISGSLTSDAFSFTPEGQIIYTSNEGGNNDLWTVNADDGDKKQLTSDEAFEAHANATPDGKFIVYLTNRNVGWSIWRLNADGSNPKEIAGNVGYTVSQVTPDSRFVVYNRDNNSLWKLPIEGDSSKPEKIIEDRNFEHRISPDGTKIAYLTRADEIDSPLQIKIVSMENGELIKVLDTEIKGGGFEWSPDGKAIDISRYVDNVSNIYRISLENEGGEAKQLTGWNLESISSFKRSPDASQTAIVKGKYISDLVLIENFQ